MSVLLSYSETNIGIPSLARIKRTCGVMKADKERICSGLSNVLFVLDLVDVRSTRMNRKTIATPFKDNSYNKIQRIFRIKSELFLRFLEIDSTTEKICNFENFRQQWKKKKGTRDGRTRNSGGMSRWNDERQRDRSSLPEPIFYDEYYLHLECPRRGFTKVGSERGEDEYTPLLPMGYTVPRAREVAGRMVDFIWMHSMQMRRRARGGKGRNSRLYQARACSRAQGQEGGMDG